MCAKDRFKLIAFVLFVSLASVTDAQELMWARQLRGRTIDATNSGNSDKGLGVATNSSGDVYLVGSTDGELGIQEAGGVEGFLASFTSHGEFRGVIQNGLDVLFPPEQHPPVPEVTPERFLDIEIDSTGNLHIIADYSRVADCCPTLNQVNSLRATLTDSSPGSNNTTFEVIGASFLGNGTPPGFQPFNGALAIDVDDTVYLGFPVFDSIQGLDPAVASYQDINADPRPTRIFGSDIGLPDGAFDIVYGSAINRLQRVSDPQSETRFYITGYSTGGTPLGFIVSLDASLNLQWSALIDSPGNVFDQANGVAVAADGSVYVVGGTAGDLDDQSNAGGGSDIFISKFDDNGSRQWTRLYGGALYDLATDIQIDDNGDLFVSGVVGGSGSSPAFGDAYVAKLDPDGDILWETTLSTWGTVNALALAPGGIVYAAGNTSADMATPFNPNGMPAQTNISDAFVVKLGANPLLLGDVNQDGILNLLDVEPFIALLGSGKYQTEADCNQDGAVNLLDVAPFVSLLGG